jgi:hypothetical protein
MGTQVVALSTTNPVDTGELQAKGPLSLKMRKLASLYAGCSLISRRFDLNGV